MADDDQLNGKIRCEHYHALAMADIDSLADESPPTISPEMTETNCFGNDS